MFNSVLLRVDIFECPSHCNTMYLSNVACLPKKLITSALYKIYTKWNTHLNFIFCAFSLANVQTNQCFVQFHVLLTTEIFKVFLATLRKECMFLIIFSLEMLISQNFFLSLLSCHNNYMMILNFSGLRGMWQTFSLNFCSAVLCHNVATDHINV
jgi:hypothetical protein